MLCDHDDAIPCNANTAESDVTTPAEAAAATAAAAPSPAAAAADAQIAAGTASPGASAAAAASATAAATQTKPTAKYELVLANPNQRFKRIVLRETCLLDHLCNGYVEGLKFVLEKAKAKRAACRSHRGAGAG